MKYRIALLLLLAIPLLAAAQKPAYQFFNAKGKKTDYDKLLRAAKKEEVTCFGELHNNAISHWLQLELAQDLQAAFPGQFVLGAEMIEADNQVNLDSLLAGQITPEGFEGSARLWNNYKTDYKPLVELALEHKLPFVASNIPRRYASMVFKRSLRSLDSLSELEQSWMMPLPVEIDYELRTYREMAEMMPDHNTKTFPAAQAVKDATMAWRIHKGLPAGQRMLHLNGSAHSDWREGIIWYLQRYRPGVRTLTIATRLQSQLDKLDPESLGAADFILVVPDTMTNTY